MIRDYQIRALASILRTIQRQFFLPAWGEVILNGGSGIDLSSNWTTLTGGSATTSGGVNYTADTGVMTLPAGRYRIDFTATQSRTLGLSAPDLDVAIFVNGSQSNAIGTHTLAAIADTRTVYGYTEVTVGASAQLTLRTRSSLSFNIATSRFQFSARRIS